MKKEATYNWNFRSISGLILIIIWTYTGLDKLIRFTDSRKAFHNQTFPAELAEVLTYAVPIVELLIAGLLLFSVSRWWGFLTSILLFTVFTTYVGLIWVGAFPRVPCNCAGIIESLGWAAPFMLNLLFLALGVFGLYQNSRKKRKVATSGFQDIKF